MLIRRKIVQTNPEPVVENNVTIVKPRRPTGLLAGLGIATLLAVGAVMYLSWYLPGTGSGYVESPAVVTAPERPQRLANPAPKPNTIIVTPPPVVQTPPPMVTTPPVVVTPPPRTIIVPGASSEPPARNQSNDTSSNNSNNSSNSNGTNNSNSGDDGSGNSDDVDGTIRGTGG